MAVKKGERGGVTFKRVNLKPSALVDILHKLFTLSSK